MEVLGQREIRIKTFAQTDGCGYGYGYGCGYSYGYGCGSGYGKGSGYGSGYGKGCGYGYGCGDGCGYGCGDGCGYGGGDGSGKGCGKGCGYGSGYGKGCGNDYGNGISMYNRQTVYYIDGIATIIKSVFGNYAKGFILEQDLQLKPCYIAKGGGCFAHGDTLADAVRDLNHKQFCSMDEEERIAEFWKCHEKGVKYPAMDLYEWHHKLTGSCEAGRKSFAAGHDIDLGADEFTTEEFVELTKNSYGGDIIRKLAQKD